MTCGFVVIFPRASQNLIIVQQLEMIEKYIFIKQANYLYFLSVKKIFSHSFSHTTDLDFFVYGHYAKGNQRRPLNLTAISATLLPAVWLTQLLGHIFIEF